MSDFPPNLSIRPLTIADLDKCIELEKRGFANEEERATPEKLAYRLTTCPELCSGLFIRDYGYKYNAINLPEVAQRLEKEHAAQDDTKDEADDEVLPIKSSVTKETLIAQIIGTKIHGPKITSDSMELPTAGNDKTGHIENSRYIGVHSVVVDAEWQGKNLGTLLMHDYIQKLSNQDLGDKVAIIVHEELIPFYEKIGFSNLGESECQFAGTKWYDMAMDLIPEDEE